MRAGAGVGVRGGRRGLAGRGRDPQVSADDASGDHLGTFGQDPTPGCAEALGCPTWTLDDLRLPPA
ncbi:hypothetical protein G5V58_18885 [Nocardioides anomalus]|uniref:Uncharacterized protein n=1 Tax=Nocardioides anomalus TaxID=2712223 RepID=A0A6G6WH60_9ACTN|nr:hypothetical protein [Nocardioides anomalus]QIG44574.1 hypothetical protein G5V58_18885 [Nocardioides anomalus]